MTPERIAIGLASLIFFSTLSWGNDDSQNFFVAAISTELHRATLSSSADTYAVVNCNPLVGDGEPDLSTLDKEGFVANLTDVTPLRSQLLLVCRYQFPVDADNALRKRINDQLKELAASAGYRRIKVSEVRTSADWKRDYQRASQFDQPAEAHEPLVENELVRVFPVRTQLSRFVHGDASCIVEIVRPIDGHTKEISSDLESSIRSAVQEVRLTEKRIMQFKLSSTSAGRDQVEILFDSRPPPRIPDSNDPVLLEIYRTRAADFKPSPGLALAQELGFERILYSHSPDGGAPETLVGAKAPSFELGRLNGDGLDLHEFIAGRPALITFWGLACGPCRLEAPHLTALHEQHGQEFSIIAVNAYNDDREAVAKYVEKEKLTHPIVLQGKTVSNDLYRVGAYPTTFWIDQTGTVVDYEVGFRSVKRLEDSVERLLKR